MSLLEMKEVSKSFASGDSVIEALKPTDFKIEKDQFVAIIGPSGSGKSTLLTILGALQTPTDGEVILNGKKLSDLSEKERAKIRYHDIGFILQSSNLIPFLSVRDQFKLIDRLNKKERHGFQDELMKKLGISDLKNKHINELSGGQKQRVAIARALYNDPLLILADEPTASLDSEKAHEVVSLLAKETKEKHKATIMVTHDIRMVNLCDKVYRMQDGVLSLVEDLEELNIK